jgi:hypothetical protein
MEQVVKQFKKVIKNFMGRGTADIPKEPSKLHVVSAARVKELFDEVELELARDTQKIDKAFDAFKSLVYSELDQLRESSEARHWQQIHREGGKINGGRRYFFIQQFNTRGWLVERSGLGWVISRAEKIAQQNLFVRHGTPFDIVSILEPADGSDRFRIRSGRWEIDHFSIDAYAKRWLKVLRDASTDAK